MNILLPESELESRLYEALFGLSEEQLVHLNGTSAALFDADKPIEPDSDSSGPEIHKYAFAINEVEAPNEIIFSWKSILEADIKVLMLPYSLRSGALRIQYILQNILCTLVQRPQITDLRYDH